MKPLALALLLAGAAAHAADDAADREYLRLREASRKLLEASCGECHDGSRKTALPKALKVFETRDADWAARMNERQLRSASARLGSDVVPTRSKEEAKPLQVAVPRKAEFDAYVAAELGRRQAH